jgi:hypothetical protein
MVLSAAAGAGHQERLARMQDAVKRLARPHAAADIVRIVTGSR